MKEKFIRISAILILLLTFVIALSGSVEAASFSALISKTTVNVGGTITLTVKATNAAGMYNIKISDESILSISSGEKSEFIENGSAKIVLKAKKAGTVKVTATADDMTDLDDSNKKVTGGKTFTIKVTEPSSNTDNKNDNNTTTEKKSNNADLSTLGVAPKEYDFTGFKKDKTSYSVTVPNNVDSLKVSYRTADSKAKVKVTGNTNLEVGTNNIKVVVTAEDGKTTKTYTIKVTKLATEEEKPGNLIDEEEKVDLFLKSLSLEGIELSPEFASNIYSYTATINMDENDLSEVKVKAEANNDKATVEITGNTNLVEGENLINVIVKSTNSSEQTVYQITVNKVSQTSEVVSSNGILDNVKNIKKEHIIIAGFVFVAIILLIILISIYLRKTTDDDTDGEELDNDIKDDQTSDNLVEELFNKKKNGEKLNKSEEETLEDIEKENDRIFNKPKKGETVEYDINENEEQDETFISEAKEKRRKGKHF